MLLLSSGTFEREIIEVGRCDQLLARFVMLGGVGPTDRDVGLVARFDYLTKRACFDDGREDFVLDSARMSTSDAMVQLGRAHLCRDEVGSA